MPPAARVPTRNERNLQSRYSCPSSTADLRQPGQVRSEIHPHPTSVREVCNRLLAEPQVAIFVETQGAGVAKLDEQSGIHLSEGSGRDVVAVQGAWVAVGMKK